MTALRCTLSISGTPPSCYSVREMRHSCCRNNSRSLPVAGASSAHRTFTPKRLLRQTKSNQDASIRGWSLAGSSKWLSGNCTMIMAVTHENKK